MVIVYQRGKIPITYSANLFSCATFVTIIVYAAALIFPYLLNGWAKNFFPLTRIDYEQPLIYTNSEINVSLLGTSLNYSFSVPSTDAANYVPAVYERSSRTDTTSIEFSLTFSTPNKGADTVYIEFPYIVNFKKSLEHEFKGRVKLELHSYAPSCSVAIHGTLGFNQQLPFTDNHLPSPNGYQEYAEENNPPVTEADSRLYGEPYFKQKSVDFVIGESNTYEITFEMHSTLLPIVLNENFWYSFLGGWTSYVAVAIPFFYFANKILEFLFGSGIITSYQHVDAVIAKEGIPKFNR
jgi:hypothetical protein